MASSTKNRILKNTIFLYIRSFLSLLIKLYTSRLVLQGIGVEDFGVYQVVGGLVAMFSFLNTSMSVAAQRFLSYEIGLNERGNVRKVFSTILYIYIIVAVVVFVLIETIGLYFLNTTLNIGNVSIETARLILFYTALTLVLTITSVPYNSMLISREDMSSFAYIDILGEIFRLAVGLSLSLFTQDRLIYYSALMFVVAVVVRIIYIAVCRMKYSDVKPMKVWDVRLFRNIASFSGWTTLASVSYLLKSQGISILLNVFIGPIINAAVGVGNQVNSALKTFSNNFQMAFMPLITKKYAEGDYQQMMKFVVSGAKLSTILMIVMAVPVAIGADFLLSLWLVEVPPHTSVIVILFLVESILQTVSCTGNTAIRATGNVRNYELCFNAVDIVSLPLIYFVMKQAPLYWIPFVVLTLFTIISSYIKIYFVKRLVPYFDDKLFITENFLKVIGVCLLSVVVPILLYFHISNELVSLLMTTISFEMIFCGITYYYLLNPEEKEIVVGMIKNVRNIKK